MSGHNVLFPFCRGQLPLHFPFLPLTLVFPQRTWYRRGTNRKGLDMVMYFLYANLLLQPLLLKHKLSLYKVFTGPIEI